MVHRPIVIAFDGLLIGTVVLVLLALRVLPPEAQKAV